MHKYIINVRLEVMYGKVCNNKTVTGLHLTN